MYIIMEGVGRLLTCHNVYLSHRWPEPRRHGFILHYLSSEATSYVRSSKPVGYILDLMKLDVPKLFIGPPDDTGISCATSVPSEKFMQDLHSYIDSNELSRELLGNLDSIMVSLYNYSDVFQVEISMLVQILGPYTSSA